MTYAERLRDPRWQRRRLERMQAAGFRCQECGDFTTELTVHHTRYRRGAMPWEYADAELPVLCVRCHPKPPDVLQAAAMRLIEDLPDDVFCYECGDLVTDAQGYGCNGKGDGGTRKVWCEACTLAMEGLPA